jgi:hypothetical protein
VRCRPLSIKTVPGYLMADSNLLPSATESRIEICCSSLQGRPSTILYVSQLYTAGVLGETGLRMMVKEVSRGLKVDPLPPVPEKSRQCMAEISAQIMLMAGSSLAESLWRIPELDQGVWKGWAVRFRELAEGTAEDERSSGISMTVQGRHLVVWVS